jgi:hypothetical protein
MNFLFFGKIFWFKKLFQKIKGKDYQKEGRHT